MRWELIGVVMVFLAMFGPDSRVPKDHPLRVIRQVTDEALASLNGLFSTLYSTEGRPSIPPEQLLRALLLQAFY